jgi:exodeoxyribonuclease V alpha subunit
MTMTLHPRGALRTRFESPDDSSMFRRLGIGARRCDLGDEGLYLAEEIVAADRWLGGSDPEALGVLVLALMIAQRQGSSRLPLDPGPKGKLRTLVADIVRVAGLDADPARIVKRITNLTATPTFNSVIGIGNARLPLVVDDNCIYTERSRWLEQRVAPRLAARLSRTRVLDAALLADLRARPGTRPLSDEQMSAVELALGGSLTVVTGGPGTGKTVVAATIVRGLARLGIAPARIALAAQTGKAANRLTEVIGQQLAAVASPSDADRALLASPPAGQTLHRLLGYRGDGFAHHARSPLPYGAVIIDEASMVDLELMDALLDAMPADVPLVLVGDAHQLPAIDAGQILADLAEPSTGARVAQLAHSYRMDASDPAGRSVYESARAVHAGEANKLTDKNGLAALRTPGTLHWQGCEWVDAGDHLVESAHAVADALWHHFDGPHAQRLASDTVFRFEGGRIDPAQTEELETLWATLARARLLTVTRGMPTGSQALNAYVHGLVLDRMTVATRPDFVPGEPVMITANDYQRGLFNGDQGIVIRADDGGGQQRFRAIFRVGGNLVPFAIEALRDRLELAWALTVHKSQGSELDALAIVLPDENQPLLTRELLYTGITRARKSAVLCGTKAAIVAAGKRVAQRHSGLAGRLRASLTPASK